MGRRAATGRPPHDGGRRAFRQADAEHFRPEFLNRIDEIVERQLERLRERLAERKLSLELTDVAKDVLAEAGWDPTYGARPLKRALQSLVENPLAQRLLAAEFAEGDTIRVDAQNGELVFERAEAPARRGVVPTGHLALRRFARHRGHVQWWRRREPEVPAELSELVVLVGGVGSILMGIDAKLELILDHLEGEDDDGD